MEDSEKESGTDRRWVWFGDTESVRDGKLSVLACFETVLMVVIYWVIAWIWDTHLHLFAGLFVMPLMLFRSDASVELGVRSAKTVDNRLDPDRLVGSSERYFYRFW